MNMLSPVLPPLQWTILLLKRLKGEGGGSSPHRESGNGGMPGEIWWAGLPCSHKQYLGSTYWQERDCSKFPTSEAGLLFLTMGPIIFCIWLGCVLSLRLSNYPSSQPTSYRNVWVSKATAKRLEKVCCAAAGTLLRSLPAHRSWDWSGSSRAAGRNL